MCLYLVEVFSSSALGSARGRVVPWNERAFSLLVVLCVLREGAALPHRERVVQSLLPGSMLLLTASQIPKLAVARREGALSSPALQSSW